MKTNFSYKGEDCGGSIHTVIWSVGSNRNLDEGPDRNPHDEIYANYTHL